MTNVSEGLLSRVQEFLIEVVAEEQESDRAWALLVDLEEARNNCEQAPIDYFSFAYDLAKAQALLAIAGSSVK
jgi:hypothetical protein